MANELMIAVQDMALMAERMGKSGLFGKTPDQLFALMAVAQAEGRHPATVALDYDVIQGRPALRSQAALTRFQQAGGKIEWVERSEKACEAKFSHPQGGTVAVRWDMARATQMGLTGKDNWRKQPMVMLQWRVVAEGVRVCYPACLGGVYLEDEVRDMEPRFVKSEATFAPASEPVPAPAIEPPKPGKAYVPEVAREYKTLAEAVGMSNADIQAFVKTFRNIDGTWREADLAEEVKKMKAIMEAESMNLLKAEKELDEVMNG